MKKADLLHNSDISRLETVDEKTYERLAKCKKAIEFLEDCETRSVFIEREVGTGWNFYKLRVGDSKR